MQPETATAMVYERVRNKNKLTKSLLLNDKLIEFIEEKSGGRNRNNLTKAGVDAKFLAKNLKTIIEDRNCNGNLRLWALKFVIKVLYPNDV